MWNDTLLKFHFTIIFDSNFDHFVQVSAKDIFNFTRKMSDKNICTLHYKKILLTYKSDFNESV